MRSDASGTVRFIVVAINRRCQNVSSNIHLREGPECKALLLLLVLYITRLRVQLYLVENFGT